MLYFKDGAESSGIHAGFVEHEELELSDRELAGLKARARRAVAMDGKQAETERHLPPEYVEQFCPPAKVNYEDFLKGKS